MPSSPGANDYVAKPKGATSDDVAARIREDVIPKLKQFRQRSVIAAGPTPTVVAPRPPRPRSDVAVAAVVVGISTGGPVAAEFLPAFVSPTSIPVLIVQHMPAVFTGHLADRLTKVCGLPVREAPDGHELRPGDILLAPGGRHLKVLRQGTKVVTQLDDSLPENSCRPAADVLFRAAAGVWGGATLGVIMTGMGKDGLKGSEAVIAAGGAILAQDEMTSVVWGMPGHVARAGLAEAVLPLGQLGVEVAMRLRAAAENRNGSGVNQPLKVTPQQMSFLSTFLKRRSGVVIDQSKAYLVEARLLPVLRQRGIPDFETLVEKVRSSREPAIEQDFLNAMMTHETSFFRDRSPFEAVKRLLPELITRRALARHLVIWSAAASSGQEAYSLAMLLNENFREAALPAGRCGSSPPTSRSRSSPGLGRGSTTTTRRPAVCRWNSATSTLSVSRESGAFPKIAGGMSNSAK